MTNLKKYLLLALLAFALPVQAQDDSCRQHLAQWLEPNSGDVIATADLLASLNDSRIVLLGESHTTAADHRWQAYMLAALHARNANTVVGFEMLPREKQSVLDAWSAGELTEQEFLEQSDWRKVWGYEAGYYLPLLHFARLHRLPTLALNIDRELVSKVGREGWQALAEEQRMGLSDPAPASEAYRESLAQLYALKQSMRSESLHGQEDQAEPDLDAIKSSSGFANFVDAQLTWDRAMAEALAAAHRRDPRALVVGIVGRGHLEFGYGIPHQLADMGIDKVDVLLPQAASENCDPLPADLASAVFVVDTEKEDSPKPRPLLGVIIESAEDGVRIMQVVEDSVAASSGLREGDLIQQAAGTVVKSNTALVEIIQRQAPGTWLPLQVLRDGKTREIVARFPPAFD